MGKKKIKSEEELKNMMLPVANDVIGIAEKMLGGERVMVKYQDGHERLCRIRGKMKRREFRSGLTKPKKTSNAE